ncbi:MAG: FHA domain-containing protein [Ktedonobacteraceae bacterium]|nr:FHA domain-containing protein [Ktedonobacteraceae bacterium]
MRKLEEGQRFKRYRIQHLLGNSAAGTSYVAEDTLQQRQVTLKQIHPWGNLPDAARRQFFREMHDISALTHPYLAPILDYGEVDGQLYVVRRYVTTGSLLSSEGRQRFNPPLDVVDAVSYTYQLAGALHTLHSIGCLHGALSFTNVLVSDGSDFNFAPLLLSDAGNAYFVRRFGQAQTTFLPITAAPEQFEHHITEASDQYALAVILYFWLTGRPPFIGTPAEIERLKRTETIITPTAVNLKVPLELEGVIRRALSAYAEDRYPSMQAFAGALQASIAYISQTSLTAPMILELDEIPASSPISTLEFIASNDPQQPTSVPPTPPVPPAPSEPLPQVVPDVPQPLHEPSPDPIPLPFPEETPPEPAPEPAPEVLPIPVPGPDVPQPLPEPKPIPPAEPAKNVFTAPIEEDIPVLSHEDLPLQASILIASPYNQVLQEILLEKDETTLGRAGSSDILLDQDTLTSRHHALLQRISSHYEIHDLRSANGVRVNGQKIPVETGFALKDGDNIDIGEYELTFFLKPESNQFEQENPQTNNQENPGLFAPLTAPLQ